MSDINFSNPNGPHGLQVIDRGQGRDHCGDEGVHACERESVKATDKVGFYLSDLIKDSQCETLNGFTRVHDKIDNGFARTNDCMSSKFENLDKFVSQNFKEQQLQAARDTSNILLSQTIGFKDSTIHMMEMKAELQKEIAECCCSTKALILAQTASATATALADAKQEILALRLGAGAVVSTTRVS